MLLTGEVECGVVKGCGDALGPVPISVGWAVVLACGFSGAIEVAPRVRLSPASCCSHFFERGASLVARVTISVRKSWTQLWASVLRGVIYVRTSLIFVGEISVLQWGRQVTVRRSQSSARSSRFA